VSCCRKRKRRRQAGEAAAVSIAPGTELQPTATGVTGTDDPVQPAPQSEVYGYYAPPGVGGEKGVGSGGMTAKEEEEAAKREVYGYFSPTVSPRAGDVVVARPEVGT
jgi:hypothetical protein